MIKSTNNLSNKTLFMTRMLWLILSISIISACANKTDASLNDSFDEETSWRSGDDFEASGGVIDGVYRFSMTQATGSVWTTAGKQFGNGVYQVDVVQKEGPIDAGYGMMLRVDDETDSFYLFEISGDGYVWIGRCLQGCEEQQILVNNWWFESTAVIQGLNVVNQLRVSADHGNLLFYVNDVEVGRFTDYSFAQGDIGLYVETLGTGGVQVDFDNFIITPLD